MEIKRDKYLQELINRMHNHVIKDVTGVRRSEKSYLTRLFEETYLKDIIEGHHIEKTQELEELVNILASAIGSLTNVPKIESTFKSVLHSKISGNTIRQYIECLEEAFIPASNEPSGHARMAI